MTQKRFLISMFACLDADDADHADERLANILCDLNARYSGDLKDQRFRICEESETSEITGEDPESLMSHPGSAVQRELDDMRKQVDYFNQSNLALSRLLFYAHYALKDLCKQCETNDEFAAQHIEELEALENAQRAEGMISGLKLDESGDILRIDVDRFNHLLKLHEATPTADLIGK